VGWPYLFIFRSADYKKRKKYLDNYNKSLTLMLGHLDEEADTLLGR